MARLKAASESAASTTASPRCWSTLLMPRITGVLVFLEQVHDKPVAAAEFRRAIDHKQNRIHRVNGDLGVLHQHLPQAVVGLVDAGGIDKDDLGLGRSEDAAQAVAGGLGSGGGDGDFLADEGVHQRRFADIGPTDDGDEPRSEPFCRHWNRPIVRRKDRWINGGGAFIVVKAIVKFIRQFVGHGRGRREGRT